MRYTHLNWPHMLLGRLKRNMGLPTAHGSNRQGMSIDLELLWSHLDLLWSLGLLWLYLQDWWCDFQALVWWCSRHMATTLLNCPHMPFGRQHQNKGLTIVNDSSCRDMCIRR